MTLIAEFHTVFILRPAKMPSSAEKVSSGGFWVVILDPEVGAVFLCEDH